MKNMKTIFAAMSLLCLLSIGIAANDNDLKEHVTITQKIWVNNTLVKPGRYLVRYDTAAGVMKLMQGDDVVAEAKATVTVNEDKFDQDALLMTTSSKGDVLTGVRLGGKREELHLTDAVTSSVGTLEFDDEKYIDFDRLLDQ